MRRDRAAYPSQVLEVRYEDLVRQSAETARTICAFLDEAFEPAMLDWQDRTALVTPRDQHLHGRLRDPLSDDAIATWRRRLSAIECFAVEACLYRELTQCNYDLRFSARGWRPLFRLTAMLLRISSPLLRRGIPYLQTRRMLPGKVYL